MVVLAYVILFPSCLALSCQACLAMMTCLAVIDMTIASIAEFEPGIRLWLDPYVS